MENYTHKPGEYTIKFTEAKYFMNVLLFFTPVENNNHLL